MYIFVFVMLPAISVQGIVESVRIETVQVHSVAQGPRRAVYLGLAQGSRLEL